MSVIYKTLFEVKLMHEFFVTGKDGSIPFTLSSQAQRLDFLVKNFEAEQLSVNDDLEYKFPESLAPTYENLGLKLFTTFSGFKVAVRVNISTPGDQVILYKPFEDFPQQLVIVITVTKKNNIVDRYTNTRLAPTIPAIYFFSNDKLAGEKAIPYLTTSVPDFDNQNVYEQGELALFGSTDIRSYYNDGTADQWQPIAGSGYASENDRLLVPSLFNYTFPSSSSVTQASFVLQDYNDNVVKSIPAAQPDALKQVRLQFGDQPEFLSSSNDPINNYLYTLNVKGNDGYSNKHKLVFADSIYTKTTWGLIGINTQTENKDFRLIAEDGFLIKRRDAMGIWTQTPVFEIPLKSRFVYWRYINNKGRELAFDSSSSLADYLFKEDKVLLTKKPRAMAKYWLLLRNDGTTATKYSPNPDSYELQRDSKGRLCMDIRVPQSDLFPVV